MKDFEKIEHLLLSKKYAELSPTEVKEVTSYFENATDYNDMRETLMQVKSTLAADKLLIKPNVELKEKLLQKFDNTHTKTSSSTLGKRKPFYKSVGFQWSAAATIVLLISVSIFGYIQNIKSKMNDGMAVNYKTPASEDALLEQPTTIVSTGENEEGKSKVTVVNPGVVNFESTDDEITLPTKLEDNEESDVMQGDANLNRAKTNENKNMYGTFGTINVDNTTIPVSTKNGIIITEGELKEDKTTNTNFYFNPKADDMKDERVKGGLEDNRNDNKNIGTEDNIPVQTQSIINYNVNQGQTTTEKDYWKKNKNKQEDKNTNSKVSLGLAQEKYIEDSSRVATDSLKLDGDIPLAPQKDLNKNHK